MTSHYTGHGARTGGLQQHSLGNFFPFIVYAKQTKTGLRWGILGPGGGDTGPYARSAFEACQLARRMHRTPGALA